MASHRLRNPVPGFLKVDVPRWAGGAAQRADLLMRCSGQEAHGDAGCSAQRCRAERASVWVWKIRERSLMRYEIFEDRLCRDSVESSAVYCYFPKKFPGRTRSRQCHTPIVDGFGSVGGGSASNGREGARWGCEGRELLRGEPVTQEAGQAVLWAGGASGMAGQNIERGAACVQRSDAGGSAQRERSVI
ncbi:hypothetical protein C8J57DRAFT_1246735 [Mycena rebaudengoi]|nr:hypothetical protein C8J57DRAFT_1246735 [Mycena rebaudengoi]